MRDVFEKYDFVAEGDVVEQNKMLMKLTHVADMRHGGHAKFAAKQAHGEKFAHARHAHGVHLDEPGAFSLQIILENDAIGNMFANRELRRRNRVGERFVAKDIVGMRRFFDPKRIDRRAAAGKCRVLVAASIAGLRPPSRGPCRQRLREQCARGANRVRDRASRLSISLR